MSELTLYDLSKKMTKLDFAMMTTKNLNGRTTARPKQQRRRRYDGESYLVAYSNSQKIREIHADSHVGIGYTGAVDMLSSPPLFVAVEGSATLIQDRAKFADHWTKDLDRYVPEGIDTAGVVINRVKADTIRYWDGNDEDEITREA